MTKRKFNKRRVGLARIFKVGKLTSNSAALGFNAKSSIGAFLEVWKKNLQMHYCQEEEPPIY